MSVLLCVREDQLPKPDNRDTIADVPICTRRWRGDLGEVALRDEVTPQLLGGGSRDGAVRTVSLEAERVLRRGLVEEKRVDARLAVGSGAFGGGLAGRTGVNEGRASGLVDFLKVDHEFGGVVLCVCEDLCSE